MSASDHEALRALAAAYARAVDRRDEPAFLAVFRPDEELRIFDPSGVPEPRSVIRGHDELAKILVRIARYERTFHLVGTSAYEVDGDDATGEVYCVAHHLGSGTDVVMYIRYQDVYRRDAAGWTIADRRVLVDWTESHPVA